MSVKRAQQEIDSLEFTHWMAYYEMEPFGEMIADIRHGGAVAMLANINRNAEKKPEPYMAEDFIWWRETSKQAEEDEEPALLADPVAQSSLIRASLFGVAPR